LGEGREVWPLDGDEGVEEEGDGVGDADDVVEARVLVDLVLREPELCCLSARDFNLAQHG
jgi:hypothetical protein